MKIADKNILKRVLQLICCHMVEDTVVPSTSVCFRYENQIIVLSIFLCTVFNLFCKEIIKTPSIHSIEGNERFQPGCPSSWK